MCCQLRWTISGYGHQSPVYHTEHPCFVHCDGRYAACRVGLSPAADTCLVFQLFHISPDPEKRMLGVIGGGYFLPYALLLK